ncbi:MAG TPA: hypothetical protein VN648_25180 [Candidatus Methylomirabilis sp.]|nr:hypothetical protein [Candidatus Methylomirabilis sp.]
MGSLTLGTLAGLTAIRQETEDVAGNGTPSGDTPDPATEAQTTAEK